MQFKSIIVSLVASAALAQAAEYATYELCWKELRGYWDHYGYSTMIYQADTMNAADCSLCILSVNQKCGPTYTCETGIPEFRASQCLIDAVLACQIPVFQSSIYAVALVESA